jgi:hypothetical protein
LYSGGFTNSLIFCRNSGREFNSGSCSVQKPVLEY